MKKPSAVEDIEAILDLADAAMVARGDLGVELALEQVPVVQRKIIRAARAVGKPVIVATHMLESMIDAPTPTRAEASDVATAIYQGADAVMLSAETAVGRHPATAVAIMDRIIAAAESDPSYPDFYVRENLRPRATVNDAISQSVRGIAQVLKLQGRAWIYQYRLDRNANCTGTPALPDPRSHASSAGGEPDGPDLGGFVQWSWKIRPILMIC